MKCQDKAISIECCPIIRRFDNTRVLHPLNPMSPDIVPNIDLEYRIVGVVMENEV